MSQNFLETNLQFHLTQSGPCPYLPDREERKLFAYLDPLSGPGLHDAMIRAGFRRSQNVVYRPMCEGCAQCLSARVVAKRFQPNRTQKRVWKRNQDLLIDERAAEATPEQYQLLKTYLQSRHEGGGMNDMTFGDYAAMTESLWARTRVFEYRLPTEGDNRGQLVGAALSDWTSDGLSMVYSFFDPSLDKRSLGVFMILHHISTTAMEGLPYVYLGYWVPGSEKMGYKTDYKPLEVMSATGWAELVDK